MNLKKFSIMGLIFIGVTLSACAGKTNTQNMYASLDTAVATYNTAFKVVQDLDRRGKIKLEDKVVIKKLFIETDFAIKAYATSLEVFVRAPNMTNKEIAERALNKALTTLQHLRRVLYEES